MTPPSARRHGRPLPGRTLPRTGSGRPPTPRTGPTPVLPHRFSDPGWVLLPLRGFLGGTFIYAGLQKLANPEFFDAANPGSIVGQMRTFEHTSPLGPLLGVAAHLPVATGLVIALGELAVGVGTVLGLYTRVAAVGGALLSLSFFLTVSWTTTPYYYGADIVFAFAWLTLFGIGDRGVLSLGAWFAARDRSDAPPHGWAAADGSVDRRAVVRVGSVAAAAAALAAITAAAGRLAGGTRQQTAAGQLGAGPGSAAAQPPSGPPSAAGTTGISDPATQSTDAPGTTPANATGGPAPTDSAGSAPSAAAGSSAATLRGTPIGPASSVPVGQAQPFSDPATGDPAWLVHTATDRFVAFDAVCTHAGCTVDYDPSSVQFQCPCHGGRFDARTGSVLQGPPEQPLRPIPVQVANGQLRVDA